MITAIEYFYDYFPYKLRLIRTASLMRTWFLYVKPFVQKANIFKREL
jgi:hypothetical protein